MSRATIRCCCFCSFLLANAAVAQQPPPKPDTSRGDKMLADYFAAETKKLQDACLADIKTLDDWKSKRGEYRRQLLEMLGLDPLPEKTDLKPVITGKIEHDEFVVEKIHFQSRPGLYVTGNLYLPKKIDSDRPLPTILYVCGHSRVLGKDGKTPMGAKAGYQHHGAWYARNGYACLTIDTLQLGEIEGIHHGTHRYGMWWWLNRGYTPAGVEAWNCVRALDYLETRPEIDKTRFGVTGRSGGGAYSWWIAAIDDRIKVAVPTAGITDLQNHVVDGCVEGHCDCMFMVNTYRWDYPQVAALLAPRPLLISNTDSDGIFPLDGVYRTFEKVRRIYRLFDAEKKGTSANVALNIEPGPHKDTQELQTNEFRWFNHYLKNDDSLIDSRAPKYFEPEQLKVFDKLPDDQVNTKIHETFVAKADPKVPHDHNEWPRTSGRWGSLIPQKSFLNWRDDLAYLTREPFERLPRAVRVVEKEGIRLAEIEYLSRVHVFLRMYVIYPQRLDEPKEFVVRILDDAAYREVMPAIDFGFGDAPSGGIDHRPAEDAWQSLKKKALADGKLFAFVAPQGVGSSAWDQSDKKQVQNRRRFYLLGTTLEAEQLHDIQSAIEALDQMYAGVTGSTVLEGQRAMAGLAVYAAILGPRIERLELYDLPKSHRDGPYFLNVERFLDMPQALAMAAERSKVVLYQDDDTGWEYPQAVAKALNWPADQIQTRRKPNDK